jgi:hypothetical protein
MTQYDYIVSSLTTHTEHCRVTTRAQGLPTEPMQ